MITLTKISKNEILFKSDSSKEYRYFYQILTFYVENAFFSEKYKDGVWDGKVKFFKKDNTFSTGLLNYVKTGFDELGLKYTINCLEDFKINFQQNFELSSNLREHQKQAVISIFKEQFGIIKIPTRGGKTFTAAETIRLSRTFGLKNSIFFVDNIDLMNQTIDEFSLFLNIPKSEIGKLHDNNILNFKEINVAMIQSFSLTFTPPKKRIKDKDYLFKIKTIQHEILKFFKSVNVVFIDEVQEYSSESRLKVIKKLNDSVLKISLSATPFKSGDELGNMNLRQVVGDIIYEVSENELIESKSLVKSDYLIIMYDDNSTCDESYTNYYENNIIKNINRNNMIKIIDSVLKRVGVKSLILTTRKSHGRILSKMTKNVFLSGDDDSEVRKKRKQKFLNKKGGTLIASDIFKKGVSLNQCSVLVNVSSGLEQSNIIQKRGRVLANVDGKNKSVIIDIFDMKEYFFEHSLERLNAYEEKIKDSGGEMFVINYPSQNFEKDLYEIISTVFKNE